MMQVLLKNRKFLRLNRYFGNMSQIFGLMYKLILMSNMNIFDSVIIQMKKTQEVTKTIKYKAKPFYFTSKKPAFQTHYHSQQQLHSIINQKQRYQTMIKQQLGKLDQLQNAQTQADLSIDKKNQLKIQPDSIEVEPFQIGDDLKHIKNLKSEEQLRHNLNPLNFFIETHINQNLTMPSKRQFPEQKSQQQYRQCFQDLTHYLKSKAFRAFSQSINTVADNQKKRKAADYFYFQNTVTKFIKLWKIEVGLLILSENQAQQKLIKPSFQFIRQKTDLLLKNRRIYGFKGITQKVLQIKNKKAFNKLTQFNKNLKKQSFISKLRTQLSNKKNQQSKIGQILLQLVKSKLQSILKFRRKMKAVESKQKVLSNIKLHRKFIDFIDQCQKHVQLQHFMRNRTDDTFQKRFEAQEKFVQNYSISFLSNTQKCKCSYIKRSFEFFKQQTSLQLKQRRVRDQFRVKRLRQTVQFFSYLSQNFIKPLKHKTIELNCMLKKRSLQTLQGNYIFAANQKTVCKRLKKITKNFGSNLYTNLQVRQLYLRMKQNKNERKRLRLIQMSLRRLTKSGILKKVFQMLKKYEHSNSEHEDINQSCSEANLQKVIQKQEEILQQVISTFKDQKYDQLIQDVLQFEAQNQGLTKYIKNRKAKAFIQLLRKNKQNETVQRASQQNAFIVYTNLVKNSVSLILGKLKDNTIANKQRQKQKQNMAIFFRTKNYTHFLNRMHQQSSLQSKIKQNLKLITDYKSKKVVASLKAYHQEAVRDKQRVTAIQKNRQKKQKIRTLGHLKQFMNEKKTIYKKILITANFLHQKQSKLFIANLLKFLIRKSRRQNQIEELLDYPNLSNDNQEVGTQLSQNRQLASQIKTQQQKMENYSQQNSQRNQQHYSSNSQRNQQQYPQILYQNQQKCPKQILLNSPHEVNYVQEDKKQQSSDQLMQNCQYESFQVIRFLTKLRRISFFKKLRLWQRKQQPDQGSQIPGLNESLNQQTAIKNNQLSLQQNQVEMQSQLQMDNQQIRNYNLQQSAESSDTNIESSEIFQSSILSQSSAKQYIQNLFVARLKSKTFNILKSLRKLLTQNNGEDYQMQPFIVKGTLKCKKLNISTGEKKDILKKSLDGLKMYCRQKKCLRTYLSEIEGQVAFYPKCQQQKNKFDTLTKYFNDDSDQQRE